MKKQITIATLFSMFSSMAFAHPGHGLINAYEGFMHPLTGWDHLLVMLAMGFWAAKLSGKARWQLPATFIIIMTIGAALGFLGLNAPIVETAIAASVMAMGVLIMINLPLNKVMQWSLTSTFALFHGLAHGVELQSDSGFVTLIGMLFATAILLGLGSLMASQRIKVAIWINHFFAWLLMLAGSYLLLS